ncbi:MAG TPA: carbohydrate ABC transporter permease [Candidatus Mediterraneibacter norfolkensis]|nr:carbohydrate ABC transporter permease [Candidatus Mediterraneibacter norfolkensis]
MTKKAKANDFSITSGNGVMSGKAKAIRWLISIILIIYTCFTIFVVGATLLNSLKTKSDLVTNFVGLPKAITLENFATILLEDDFLLYFRNSLILTVCGTLGCIILSAMAAYGIARYEFKGKSLLSSYFLIGMMVPIQVSVLPLFLILRQLGLLNHLIGLVLVYISQISMSCLIFQKFFRTIPKALEESARLDGCHDLKIFFRIVLPICKPVIFTMSLITAIGYWNDFYMPMVLLGNKNVRTLTLAIYQYIGQFTKYMSESMAAVIVTLIPIVIIYFLFSSQIVEGLTGGAVKG